MAPHCPRGRAGTRVDGVEQPGALLVPAPPAAEPGPAPSSPEALAEKPDAEDDEGEPDPERFHGRRLSMEMR